MPTLEDLAEDNPDIAQQAAEWRAARAANGEDPDDWQAFREHVQAIGAPDPGEDEPDDFHSA